MYGLPIEKRAETAKVTLRKACNGTANTKKFSEALAGLPQTPKSFPRDLRDSRKHQKFLERLAGTLHREPIYLNERMLPVM